MLAAVIEGYLKIVGCFIIKGTRPKVKVPVEYGTSPVFNLLFIGPLSTFAENFS